MQKPKHNTERLVERLDILANKLEMDGLYVSAATAWDAAREIEVLRAALEQSEPISVDYVD